MRRRQLWFQGLVLLAPAMVQGQQQFDSAHGNYAGLSGVLWNPASVADNCYAVQIQAAGLDAHDTNSAFRYTGPWKIGQPIASLSLQGANVAPLNNDHPKLFSTGFQLRGPGVMFRIGQTGGFSLSTRVRASFQGNGISQSLLQGAVYGFRNPGGWSNSTFNLNLNTVTEWNVSYGRVLVHKGPHIWKVGLTAKRLIGMGSAYAQGQSINYVTASNPYFANANGVIVINQMRGAYGYSHADQMPQLDFATAKRSLLGQGATGYGWGADVGFVYEYRSSTSRTRVPRKRKKPRAEQLIPSYLLRVSTSMTDLGTVNYTAQTVSYGELSQAEVTVLDAAYAGIGISNYEQRLAALYQTAGKTPKNSYVAGLPTALNINVDYHLAGSLFVNAALSQRLQPRTAIGLQSFSYVSIAPRLETHRLEIAVPVSLVNNYMQPAVGLHVRAGFLTIGSNNLSAFFGSAQPYGANVYAEVSLLKVAAKKKL